MSLFTSDRERRLWLWTLAVLLAIYSTLGPAATLVRALRERNLLRLSLAFVLLFLLGVVIGRWLLRPPGRGEIAVALGVTAAYLMAWFRIHSPEERTHLLEYSLVAILIHQALNERQSHGPRVPFPAALTVLLTALLGLLDEGIQAILPNRFFDLRDVGFNALAGLMAVVASLALARARRWRWRCTTGSGLRLQSSICGMGERLRAADGPRAQYDGDDRAVLGDSTGGLGDGPPGDAPGGELEF